MINLQNFLVEDKNTHLEHLEDDIINNGFEGGQNAVNFLTATADLLSGNSSKSVSVTTKWDGAPAVFCGFDPIDGEFFVGTKGVFNATPKLAKSVLDCEQLYSGDLQTKMITPLLGMKMMGKKILA